MTSHPSNESELQIYRVLQRANLLSYYDTFIAQGKHREFLCTLSGSMIISATYLGGDDVQQLCEAGEAEFLEIMDLVGMASKPMHVRRLQKALQEWVQNPGTYIVVFRRLLFFPSENLSIYLSEWLPCNGCTAGSCRGFALYPSDKVFKRRPPLSILPLVLRFSEWKLIFLDFLLLVFYEILRECVLPAHLHLFCCCR